MAFQNPIASFVSTDVENPDQLLAHDADGLLTYKETVLTGQVLLRGTLVGKITASGKVIKSLTAAVDGSQTPYGIVAHDVDATAADKEGLIYVSGNFNAHKVILGAGWTAATAARSLMINTPITLELNPVIAP